MKNIYRLNFNRYYKTLFILCIFRRPLVAIVAFLAFHFNKEVLGREVRLHVNIKVNFIFLYGILLETFDRKVFDQFTGTSDAIEELDNLVIQFFTRVGSEIFKSAAIE